MTLNIKFIKIALMSTILLSGISYDTRSQNSAPKYVDMAFIKSKSPDFIALEKEQLTAVHRQLIKEGKKVAWLLYKVKFPTGAQAPYDYVRFNVLTDWKQTEASGASLQDAFKKVYPNVDVIEFNKKAAQSHEIVWEQLFQIIDEAVTTKEPSQFIIVNQVKSVAGEESEYVKMERTYFKPFHAERVKAGVMTNWSLYKTSLPYGTKYEYDYVTLNGFKTWEDIIRNPPAGTWEKVHGKLNFDEIHTKILSKRMTVNNELWELVAYATE